MKPHEHYRAAETILADLPSMLQEAATIKGGPDNLAFATSVVGVKIAQAQVHALLANAFDAGAAANAQIQMSVAR